LCVEIEVGYVVAEGEEVGFAAAFWTFLVGKKEGGEEGVYRRCRRSREGACRLGLRQGCCGVPFRFCIFRLCVERMLCCRGLRETRYGRLLGGLRYTFALSDVGINISRRGVELT
jgi:hypothetical protein